VPLLVRGVAVTSKTLSVVFASTDCDATREFVGDGSLGVSVTEGEVVAGDGLGCVPDVDGVVTDGLLRVAGCFCISATISGQRIIFHTPPSSTTSLLPVCELSLAKSLYR
jgi:hypothetical protein